MLWLQGPYMCDVGVVVIKLYSSGSHNLIVTINGSLGSITLSQTVTLACPGIHLHRDSISLSISTPQHSLTALANFRPSAHVVHCPLD